MTRQRRRGTCTLPLLNFLAHYSAAEHRPNTLAGFSRRLTATTRCFCSPQPPMTPYMMRSPLSLT